MKKIKAIYIIFFLFPIINLLTGLMTRYEIFPLTIGVMTRIALLLFLVMYVLFLSKSKYKIITLIYFIIVALFIFGYFITKPEYFTLQALYNEFNTMFKFLYFPVLFFGILNLCNEYGFDKKKWGKILLFGLIFYVVFILLPIVFQSSFNSYVREKYGLIGWFYAANEVGPILLMLYPLTFTLVDNHKVCFLVISSFSILAILAISTKTVTIGLGIIILSYFILYCIFKRKKYANKILILVVSAIYILLYSPIGENLYFDLEKYNSKDSELSIELEKPTNPTVDNKPQNSDSTISANNFLTILLSNRDKKVIEVNENYIKANISEKLFGLGFYDLEKESNYIIEMDFLDIFYHYGIIGFIVLIFPYMVLLINIVKVIKNKEFKLSLNLCYSILIVLLLLAIGFLAGHVISAPAVSSFLAIYFVYILSILQPQKFQLKQDK